VPTCTHYVPCIISVLLLPLHTYLHTEHLPFTACHLGAVLVTWRKYSGTSHVMHSIWSVFLTCAWRLVGEWLLVENAGDFVLVGRVSFCYSPFLEVH